MNIIIHCGGLPFNGNTIKEKSLGGSETAAYYMAKELVEAGHRVTLFTSSQDVGVFDGVNYVFAGPATEQAPLGTLFDYYALHTPHDVLIIQRHPAAFVKTYASRINLLWLHDLALLRSRGEMARQLWNVDGILAVSMFHRDQIVDVWNVNPEIVHVVPNGVDLDLYDLNRTVLNDTQQFTMTYSSRPERGLEHLVRPGGIMERLLEEAPRVHLNVCGYDNTVPAMREFYEYLWQRCEELPNVTNLGALTKQELANLQMDADLHCYPSEFEETSCITAMECAAAQLVLMGSVVGALPETAPANGAVLVSLKDGAADEDMFVSLVQHYANNGPELHAKALAAREYAEEHFTWSDSAFQLLLTMEELLDPSRMSEGARARYLMRMSDIAPYQWTAQMERIPQAVLKEREECYAFYDNNTFEEHYKGLYEYEKERGVEYGPENLDGNLRFESISALLADLPPGSIVLDYGCAHGHYTINLAKRFPHIIFSGVDIAASNIEKARDWQFAEGLENCSFEHGTHETLAHNEVDLIIVGEVLEHVADPAELINSLSVHLSPNGRMAVTTPFGPWEDIGYREHWPWRAHLYHFERDDLDFMFGKDPDYKLTVIPSSVTPTGEALGCYLSVFSAAAIPVVYKKCAAAYTPAQTLTVAFITRDAEVDVARMLRSVLPVVDEVVVGVDKNTTDKTVDIIRSEVAAFRNIPLFIAYIDSPVDTGFDEARNKVIQHASGDWIFWMDDDEELYRAENLKKYIRYNQFNGYALTQSHISGSPPGVIKTDMPCKLFRNHKDIKFFGVVHEHPETALNEGIPYTYLIPDVDLAHFGYPEESKRRERFGRNITLLTRDREKYPERILGKFLWLRDLAQMNRYEVERTGKVSDAMRARAQEGIDMWRELMELNPRMATEGVEFYSTCVQTLGGGFDFSFTVDTSKAGRTNIAEVIPVTGQFASEEDAAKLFNLVLHERVKDYETKYF